MGNFIVQDNWKTKNKMGECRLEGHSTDPRNKRVEETTHKTENNGDRCLLREARAQKGL